MIQFASGTMKITEIRDMVVPIKSGISNAFISFSEMTSQRLPFTQTSSAMADRLSALGSIPMAGTRNKVFYASAFSHGC